MGATDRYVGQGAEGLVSITLDLGRDLVDVTLDPRARRLDTDDLASAFEDAFRDARRQVDERTAQDRSAARAETERALADAQARQQELYALTRELAGRVGGRR